MYQYIFRRHNSTESGTSFQLHIRNVSQGNGLPFIKTTIIHHQLSIRSQRISRMDNTFNGNDQPQCHHQSYHCLHTPESKYHDGCQQYQKQISASCYLHMKNSIHHLIVICPKDNKFIVYRPHYGAE